MQQPERQGRPQGILRHIAGGLNLLVSFVVAGAVLYVSTYGLGPVPALGSAFNPGTGVWAAGSDAALPSTTPLHLAGLDRPATVVFERNGTAHVRAATDHDLFLALGYLHARFRLLQMDLQRRQGEGLLSQVLGAAGLQSDEFELQLGLQRTAQAEWAAMKPGSAAYAALTAYARGVNDRIDEAAGSGNLPIFFKLLNYRPTAWQPVDSLVVQGDLVQTLDLTSNPLNQDLLVKALGYTHVKQWFPNVPLNPQHPYDPGPYPAAAAPAALAAQRLPGASQTRAVAGLLRRLAALPSFAIHDGANSNNWAVDGTKTASGHAMLAGDPHLHQTLPAVWYQVEGSSPTYYFNGVSIPGTPIILIGHNRHVSWSLTNVQNQASLFYIEKTDAVHNARNQYFWRGAWHDMTGLLYSIPVKGEQPHRWLVRTTVHGPIIQDAGEPSALIALDWIGALPTDDIDAMLGVIRSTSWPGFRDALRTWHAPSQNFVYADDRGNIGMISAGYYPIVAHGDPSLPLPGTGESDIVGTIPFDRIPQVYNPPSHIVLTANQRPVDASYPYYIGTADNYFDNGYRANRIYQVLVPATHLGVADMERLQNDTHDYLAALVMPRLLTALTHQPLNAAESQAVATLQRWDGDMTPTSTAPTLWWIFWSTYLQDTFNPWWTAGKVPVRGFSGLGISAGQTALVEDLETWTLRDPSNPAFTPPSAGATRRTATDVMRIAFRETVALLSQQLGIDQRSWHWGQLHQSAFPSLTQVASLGYGPRARGGDAWTVNAAPGVPLSSDGPSWRFIMDWGRGQGEGVYPGGQSENSLSPWYKNRIDTWWAGHYDPMLDLSTTSAQPGSATWSLTAP